MKSTQTLENCRYFLIDRDSHRHKFDNKLKNEGPEVTANVERIRADIQNLVLEKFPGVTLDTNVRLSCIIIFFCSNGHLFRMLLL